MKKAGRNDPCPCGSGKKFKKCCESKMISGRFMAAKVDAASATQIRKAVGLTSLFQARLAETPKKTLPSIPAETASAPQSEESKNPVEENPMIEIKGQDLLK